MSAETLNLTPAVYHYLQTISLREHPILRKLREATHRRNDRNMQISPEQGQFMGLLIELLGAKKALDIGTYTGYSALVVALSMPLNGKVISCDLNAATSTIAQQYWQAAKMEHKIEMRLAPALETLDKLLQAGENETFDFSFIDADKFNYPHYYEKSLQLLRSGGLIAIDNVLWGGSVADPNDQDKQTCVIRDLNAQLLHDERVTLCMLPIGDGLTLLRKR